MSEEHITDGKPCWCGPEAKREGEAIIWVHREIPAAQVITTLKAALSSSEARLAAEKEYSGQAHDRHERMLEALKASEARVGRLESEFTRLRAERDALIASTGEHITVRSEQYAELTRLRQEFEGAKVLQESMRAELTRLREREKVLVEALKTAEWVQHNDDSQTWSECPACYSVKVDGHKADCAILAALSAEPVVRDTQ